jgi:hypothetical protein
MPCSPVKSDTLVEWALHNHCCKNQKYGIVYSYSKGLLVLQIPKADFFITNQQQNVRLCQCCFDINKVILLCSMTTQQASKQMDVGGEANKVLACTTHTLNHTLPQNFKAQVMLLTKIYQL